MFYNQLIKLCEEHNEKPTPLLKSLGLSATNLKRWQNGSTVNSDILAKLSEHFEVPVDYFLRKMTLKAAWSYQMTETRSKKYIEL